jgi:hypothetical protein
MTAHVAMVLKDLAVASSCLSSAGAGFLARTLYEKEHPREHDHVLHGCEGCHAMFQDGMHLGMQRMPRAQEAERLQYRLNIIQGVLDRLHVEVK